MDSLIQIKQQESISSDKVLDYESEYQKLVQKVNISLQQQNNQLVTEYESKIALLTQELQQAKQKILDEQEKVKNQQNMNEKIMDIFSEYCNDKDKGHQNSKE